MKWKPYDYARKRTEECSIDWPMRKTASLLIKEDIGSMLVKDAAGKYVGMLTDKIILKAISDGVDLADKTVGDLQLEPLIYVNKNAGIDEVMMKFKETPSGRLVMVDEDGRAVAVLKKKNIDRFSIFHTVNRILRR